MRKLRCGGDTCEFSVGSGNLPKVTRPIAMYHLSLAVAIVMNTQS